MSNEFSGVCYSWEEYLRESESASVSEFVIDVSVKGSTRFATKDIASMTSLTFRLLTHLPDDSSDGFTSKTTRPVPPAARGIVRRFCGRSSLSASPAISICSRYLTNSFAKNWNKRIGPVLLLFLGGITDSPEFIGHGGKTDSNCLLQPILHGV